jgi:heme-degrading monooxygenase HmoA
LEESIRVVRDVLVPQYKTQKGFQGLLFLADASTNKCFSISFWETEAERKAHEESGHHAEQLAKGAHLVVEPQQVIEQRQFYEVALLA